MLEIGRLMKIGGQMILQITGSFLETIYFIYLSLTSTYNYRLTGLKADQDKDGYGRIR